MRLLFRNYCYDYDYCYDDHQEKTIWHWQLDGLYTACAVCVCVCMRAVSVFLCIYAATLSKPRRLAGWPGLVTFVLRLLLQCVAGVRERRRKRSGCSCYGMRRTIGKERERRRE
jgi:hypothetical protein